MADSQSQASARTCAVAGEKRLEDVFQGRTVHATTGVFESDPSHATLVAQPDDDHPALIHALQPVDQQVQDHLLDLLWVGPCGQARGRLGVQLHPFSTANRQVLRAVQHRLNQPGQIGPLPGLLPTPAKCQQLFRDVLTPKGLFLNHGQVAAKNFRVICTRPLGLPLLQPQFQSLSAEGNACQRVVNLVRHPGRQKTNAGQTLATHQLTAALCDLPLQIGRMLLQTGHHRVESAC